MVKWDRTGQDGASTLTRDGKESLDPDCLAGIIVQQSQELPHAAQRQGLLLHLGYILGTGAHQVSRPPAQLLLFMLQVLLNHQPHAVQFAEVWRKRVESMASNRPPNTTDRTSYHVSDDYTTE